MEKMKRKTNFATTDKSKGALKQLADNEGYETFVVPDDVGGRYSVLTAVGLLPIATAGINIESIMIGAAKAREELSSEDLEQNIAYQYATIRNILYSKGYTTEMLINYEPSMQYFNEWWKQLYGESEGKRFQRYLSFKCQLHNRLALFRTIRTRGSSFLI